MKNILDIRSRGEFRQWLTEHCDSEKECCVAVKRGKTPSADDLWHIDAVEDWQLA